MRLGVHRVQHLTVTPGGAQPLHRLGVDAGEGRRHAAWVILLRGVI